MVEKISGKYRQFCLGRRLGELLLDQALPAPALKEALEKDIQFIVPELYSYQQKIIT